MSRVRGPRWRWSWTASLALAAWAAAGSGAVAADCDPAAAEREVRDVFELYKDALVRGDGMMARELVDAGTLHYFAELKRTALSGDEEEVRARSFVDRLLVVSMRHALAPEVIRELTFEGLIATAMTEGWIRPETVAGLQMGAVTVTGGAASGEAISAGLPAPAPAAGAEPAKTSEDALQVSYLFACEAGEWRFRFDSLVHQLDRLVSELTRELGTEEDALIFSLVEAFTGKKVLPDVWQPLTGGGPPG
jgi:hypothetical protein